MALGGITPYQKLAQAAQVPLLSATINGGITQDAIEPRLRRSSELLVCRVVFKLVYFSRSTQYFPDVLYPDGQEPFLSIAGGVLVLPPLGTQ